MTKSEFLSKLQEALENDLDGAGVRENLNYYNSYIDGEIRNGRSEAEVLAELGDPWVIAQSVIGMSERRSGAEECYSDSRSAGNDHAYSYGESWVRTYSMDKWWQKLLWNLGKVGIILLIIALIMGIFAVIGGIISFFMPVILLVIVVTFAVKLINRR